MTVKTQPTIFPDNIQVFVSTKENGNVLDRSVGIHHPSTVTNRTKFCADNGLSYGDVVFHRIIYSPEATYRLVADVDGRSTTSNTDEIVADALFTDQPRVGMLLPVADCIATVLFDPSRGFLALAHMGRHSTLAGLLTDLVGHFRARGSNPRDILVWMGPSVQKESYRMEFFDHKDDPTWQGFYDEKDGAYRLDMQGYNRQRLIEAGVPADNIEISPINTATDPRFFSHSGGDKTDRFAVVAIRTA